MRRALALLGLVALLAACDAPAPPPARVLMVGDSVTGQYRARAQELLLPLGLVGGVRWYPGTNVALGPWAAWVAEAPERLEWVVYQDVTDSCCDQGGFTPGEYVMRAQEFVDVAHRRGALVLEVLGHHPDLGAVGFDRRVEAPPADAPDGVHYSPEGARRLAAAVCHAIAEECNG